MIPGCYSYYSSWSYQQPYRHDNTKTSTSYVFETNLYDVSNNSLIYSAESKTADARSMAAPANDYARFIVRDMKKKNVFGGDRVCHLDFLTFFDVLC